MTGPEHYVEAERILRDELLDGDVARAQVHATLALAAAVGCALSDPGRVEGLRLGDGEAWERVASVLAHDDDVDGEVIDAEIIDEDEAR